MFNEEWKHAFLTRTNWLDAVETKAGEDWALRKFSRLTKNGQTVILMQSLPDNDPRATLGHKVADYVNIAAYLKGIGFPAPKIIEQDVDHGLLLIEDFGDTSLHELITGNSDLVEKIYLDATKLLLRFYRDISDNQLNLPNYFDSAIYKGRRRVMDWYYPATKGEAVAPQLVQEYLDVWKQIEDTLPMPIFTLSHADYHPHNLMVIKNDTIGLIDFQGAIWAPAPYDLVNLLEDARRIVPEEIKAKCLAVFQENLNDAEWNNFIKWYEVLACQFHCRVIGQAIRLAVKENKTRLLDYVSNLKFYLVRDLQSPVIAPLKIFFDKAGLDFSSSTSLNLSPDLYSPDAF